MSTYNKISSDFNKISNSVKVIAVTSGKGGVGKSSISLNLAVSMAKERSKVLLLDGDLNLPNLDIMLGLQSGLNLSHVVADKCRLIDTIVEGPYGLKVVPGASGSDEMAKITLLQQAGLIDAFNELEVNIDYLIVDTAAGISDTVLSFARSSQEIIVVACNEPSSLHDTCSLIRKMNKEYKWKQFRLIANMVDSAAGGRDLYAKLSRLTESLIDVQLDYLGAIPFDERMISAAKKQQSIVTLYPNSCASKALMHLAKIIHSRRLNIALGGNTSFFVEQLALRAS